MEKPKSYCEVVSKLGKTNPHKIYHDTAYGFPVSNDIELFERLVLEINQAGLSWNTILLKQENFRKAYDRFNIKKIALYNDKDIERLMNDAGIIRNRLKIKAAIENAKKIVNMQKEYGSFKKWLDCHHPKSKDEWTSLFKKTFKFTGGEIVSEFLLSTGYLPNAHIKECIIYEKILGANPPWTRQD